MSVILVRIRSLFVRAISQMTNSLNRCFSSLDAAGQTFRVGEASIEPAVYT